VSSRPKAIVSWSSGKDSAFALHETRQAHELDVVGLLTTVTTAFARVSMHGVREELLARQVAATGLPCRTIGIPSPCPNEVYERELLAGLAAARDEGITHVVFGDLFLADVRAYREALLARLGLICVFPLWQRDTATLAREMLALGVRAILTCVDPRQLEASFVGRDYDGALLAELPASVDSCGERGEFHTFVTDGPMFREPIAVRRGEVVLRDGFAFADLLPA
jgi:uncharacterized protein (TIGR00290 family)